MKDGDTIYFCDEWDFPLIRAVIQKVGEPSSTVLFEDGNSRTIQTNYQKITTDIHSVVEKRKIKLQKNILKLEARIKWLKSVLVSDEKMLEP